MRSLLVALLIALSATPAFPQSAPPAAGPPSAPTQTQKPAGPTSLTKFVCKPLCDKAGLGLLTSKDELEGFTACADALLCLDAYPPVAVERRNRLDFFGLGS